MSVNANAQPSSNLESEANVSACSKDVVGFREKRQFIIIFDHNHHCSQNDEVMESVRVHQEAKTAKLMEQWSHLKANTNLRVQAFTFEIVRP